MRTTRLVVVLSGAAATVLLLAGTASAHVTVHSSDATSGGTDAAIAFRVPNESSKANVTKVVIALPADKPLAGVLAAPVPGWKVATSEVKLATPIQTDDGTIGQGVSTVTWTATATGYGPGQYQDFSIAVGLLPTADSLTFKAIQTYSDGEVDSWIETQAAGGTQGLAHPAPVLSLRTAAAHPAASATATPTASAVPVTEVVAESDSSAKALGGAGLGLGAVALLVAVAALLRGRSSKA